jgi:hypothetical protein
VAVQLLWLDESAGNAVAVCRRCGWRSAPRTQHELALIDADEHRLAQHPIQARDTDKKRRRRARLRQHAVA